jgi:hypothetical protein
MEGIRISRGKRLTKEKPKPQPTTPSERKAADQALIACFVAGDYLNNPDCQKLMRELARDWKGKNPTADALIAPFHPLSQDDVKQASDLDAYSIQSIWGTLNRVHVVKKNGAASTNPPPEDSLCESCHARGWLRKEYRASDIDGAVAPAWICPDCSEDVIKPPLDDLEKTRPEWPKVNLQVLDDNPRLMKLMLETLQLAIPWVKQTRGWMQPFVQLETFSSSRMIQTFKTDRLEKGLEESRKAVLVAPPEARRYALAWLGYSTVEGVRYESVFVAGGEKGDEQGAKIAQRYRQRLPDIAFEPIGNLMILPPGENLLTLSRDPDAASKLQPMIPRITADMAHNHGPSRDETLTYEIKKCPAICLSFGDLDRPFRKELQKEPDMVHVAMGPHQSWITLFKPEAKEVILARDTLLPIAGSPPFPGFTRDGVIALGYAPPESAIKRDGTKGLPLIILWMTMFKVSDKDER